MIHRTSQRSRLSRAIKSVFFASFLFALKKKEVGCRAETRRIFWLVNVLFRPGSELQIPLNPPLLKGEMKPAGIFLLFD